MEQHGAGAGVRRRKAGPLQGTVGAAGGSVVPAATAAALEARMGRGAAAGSRP